MRKNSKPSSGRNRYGSEHMPGHFQRTLGGVGPLQVGYLEKQEIIFYTEYLAEIDNGSI